MTLDALRNAAGSATLAVQMWEMEHGHSSNDPEYQRLLQASADAQSALRCEVAKIAGEWNFAVFAEYGI
jgi:hypothetical protein